MNCSKKKKILKTTLIVVIIALVLVAVLTIVLYTNKVRLPWSVPYETAQDLDTKYNRDIRLILPDREVIMSSTDFCTHTFTESGYAGIIDYLLGKAPQIQHETVIHENALRDFVDSLYVKNTCYDLELADDGLKKIYAVAHSDFNREKVFNVLKETLKGSNNTLDLTPYCESVELANKCLEGAYNQLKFLNDLQIIFGDGEFVVDYDYIKNNCTHNDLSDRSFTDLISSIMTDLEDTYQDSYTFRRHTSPYDPFTYTYVDGKTVDVNQMHLRLFTIFLSQRDKTIHLDVATN